MTGITRVAGIVEPLRSYNYEVVLPSDFGDPSRLRYQVSSVEFPVWFSLSTQEIVVANLGKRYLPVDFGRKDDVTIEFWESEDFAVQNYFDAWRRRIVGENVVGELSRELVSVPSQWLKDIEVLILNTKGEQVGRYRLVGCFPIDLEIGRLEYSANDLLTVTVRLVVHGIQRLS